jgi:hypothetical protein
MEKTYERCIRSVSSGMLVCHWFLMEVSLFIYHRTGTLGEHDRFPHRIESLVIPAINLWSNPDFSFGPGPLFNQFRSQILSQSAQEQYVSAFVVYESAAM